MTSGSAKYAWTDERVAMLRQCVEDGLPASVSVERMPICTGETLTRNSMIGKAKRLGIRFSSNDLSVSVLKQKPATKQAKPPVVKPIKAPAPPKVVAKPKPVSRPAVATKAPGEPFMLTIMELHHGNCRWPLGDPLHDDFAYCGLPWKRESGPYCIDHHRLAYLPRKGSQGPGSGFVLRRRTGVTA